MKRKMKVYLCGPTVYNTPHIGNMRPIMFFDLWIRAKKALGVDVDFLHNITDIDDKIINKAIEANQNESQISEKYSQQYLEILNNYNINTISQIVYVTKSLDKIDIFVKKLLDKKAAYQHENNVFFNVPLFSNYGSVSKQKTENLKESELLEGQKSSFDFSLWKDTKIGVKYQTQHFWGRPGWHTECAAFIHDYFQGEQLDFHGGGIDLTFPHHENENIQFFALNNYDITKQWLRTGMIFLNNEKMAKSTNNFYLATDFINDYSADIFRMIILNSGQLSEVNINQTLLDNVTKMISKFKKAIILNKINQANSEIATSIDMEKTNYILTLYGEREFAKANSLLNDLRKNDLINELEYILNILGFQFINDFDLEEIKSLYFAWKNAQKNKDFVKADHLKAILTEKGL